MKFLKFAGAAVALILSGQAASAATFVDYKGKAAYGHAKVWGVGSDYGGTAASFKMHDAGNGLGQGERFIAFCLDVDGIVGDDYYEINNDDPFDTGRKLTAFQKKNIEDLYQASYARVDVYDDVQAAAFQLALWEAAYETDDSVALALNSGTRMGSSNSVAIMAKADEYLARLASWGGKQLFEVNFLDAAHDKRQDLVTATLIPTPLPAGGLLLVVGLGALGAAKRRRDKRASA